MRVSRVAVALTLVVGMLFVPSSAAQEGIEYHYRVEDAALDDGETCMMNWDLDLSGGCDILAWEAGNDAHNLYIRFDMGAVTWPSTETGATVRSTLAAPGGTFMVQFVNYGDGTTVSRAGCQDTGPLPEGMTHFSNSDTGTLDVVVPLASLGASIGDEIGVVDIEVRPIARDPRPGSVLLCGTADTATPAGPIVLVGTPSSSGPVVEHVNVTGDEVTFAMAADNATSAVLVHNWTQNLTDVQLLVQGALHNGSVNLTLIDGANQTLYNGSLLDLVDPQGENATANLTQLDFAVEFLAASPGNWTIITAADAFVGDLNISLVPYVPPQSEGNKTVADQGDEPGKEGAGKEDGADADGPASPNGTQETLGGSDEQEAPGLAMLALLGVMVVLARRRR